MENVCVVTSDGLHRFSKVTNGTFCDFCGDEMKDDSNNEGVVATQPAEEGDGQRCRYCEGDIDTGWVTLCSLHAATPALRDAAQVAISILTDKDADPRDAVIFLQQAVALAVADKEK